MIMFRLSCISLLEVLITSSEGWLQNTCINQLLYWILLKMNQIQISFCSPIFLDGKKIYKNLFK